MSPDVTRCIQMYPDVSRCLQMSPNVTRCLQMSPDVTRWHQMSSDVTRCDTSVWPDATVGHSWFLKREDLFGRNVTIASCPADKATVGQIPRQPSWHPVLSSAIIPLHHCTAHWTSNTWRPSCPRFWNNIVAPQNTKHCTLLYTAYKCTPFAAKISLKWERCSEMSQY